MSLYLQKQSLLTCHFWLEILIERLQHLYNTLSIYIMHLKLNLLLHVQAALH